MVARRALAVLLKRQTNDVGRKNDIYRVSSEGGTPMPVTADRFTNEFQGAPSPDGATLAFAARGVGDSQWWRNGHSHLDESEIWLRKEGSPAAYEKIVDLNGAQRVAHVDAGWQDALLHVG